MTRLRTVSPTEPGWSRRRSGRGFRYFDADGSALRAEEVQRVKALVIPPAWADVWICAQPNGHIQAIGTDARRRRQYIYHPQWRVRRDAAKHDRVLKVAARLPAARLEVAASLTGQGMPRERALAAAFRLLDLGYFRIGSDSYVTSNGSYGLTTLEIRHVQRHGATIVFEFAAKSGISQHIEITDPAALAAVRTMTRHRRRTAPLLAYQASKGWQPLEAPDVNEYLKELLGDEMTAKDFRTWHGTVYAAVALARQTPADTPTKRKRAIASAMRDVADHLGNTPAVARSAYVDPRLIDLYADGQTIAASLPRIEKLGERDPQRQERLERAVRRLLKT
ncbi:DNA topoisomerase IB [Jatrophihabitans sp. GAS493]|uniref:DNA topoisomerase IB n=1 Tax=Jatrophihabitans sp. GAS493 TaxID=1907575 RepID=UPI000BB98393|nr:DNA topoisomerase IB [Jatrophihabitans sp. GAS493]SOD74926.1 DNA topoisomerase IB [Jatrophihabitans sp. GAS493]